MYKYWWTWMSTSIGQFLWWTWESKLPIVQGHNRYWHAWIVVTTWWTLIPFRDSPKNGQKKIFFHFPDPTILTSCDSKWLHWLFRLTMIRDLIQEVGRVHKPHTKRHNKHWPLVGEKIWCYLCSPKNKETVMEF